MSDSDGVGVAGVSGAGRVLVVDSDSYRRTFLVQMLMETGRRVLMAGDGAEARAILSHLAARVDAVIVSPVLADGSGAALIAALLAEGAEQRLVLVANDRSEAVPAGAAQLVRPLTRDKLQQLLG